MLSLFLVKYSFISNSLRLSSVQKAWCHPPGHVASLRTPLVPAPLRDSSRRAKALWSETRGRSAPRGNPKVFFKYFIFNTATGEKSGEMLASVTLASSNGENGPEENQNPGWNEQGGGDEGGGSGTNPGGGSNY